MTADWSDSIYERLLAERVVSLFGRLDDAVVTKLAAELWSLDAVGDEPITLLLSVSGGTLDATAALIDVLDVIGVEVRGLCVGGVTGPPVGILAAVRHREAAPNARFVLKDEEVRLEGSFRDLEASVRQHHDQRLRLLSRIAESTGGRRSVGDLLADFERGRAMSADEARTYGLIDRVASSSARIGGRTAPRPGFGFRRP